MGNATPIVALSVPTEWVALALFLIVALVVTVVALPILALADTRRTARRTDDDSRRK
jgi:hypothetical protein